MQFTEKIIITIYINFSLKAKAKKRLQMTYLQLRTQDQDQLNVKQIVNEGQVNLNTLTAQILKNESFIITKEQDLVTLKSRANIDWKVLLELEAQITNHKLGIEKMLEIRKELFPGNRINTKEAM